jgi:DNA-binding NarL/FixJ family response regulator
MNPITILLVEDQTLMRQGLKTILELEAGTAVVGKPPTAKRRAAGDGTAPGRDPDGRAVARHERS